MTDFSVVVLPAPLRPSSVTTSPSRTSNVTPWSTCDSPYQALRSRTTSMGLSGMGGRGAHVALDHVGIARDRPIVAPGQHLAPGEHRDHVGQVLHHVQVVL